MQPTLASNLLLHMENLYVVGTLTLLFLLIRVMWMRHRRANPLPTVTLKTPPVRDRQAELLWLAMLPVILIVAQLAAIVNANDFACTIIGIAGYIGLTEAIIHNWWPDYRKKHPLPAPKPPIAPVTLHQKDMVLEIIDTILIALVLVFGIVRPFLLQTFFIPSASMETTLLGPDKEHPRTDAAPKPLLAFVRHNPVGRFATDIHGGDKLIASKFILRFRPPHWGEIIVFDPPIEAYEGGSLEYPLRRWLRENPRALTPDEAGVLTQYFVQNLNKYNQLLQTYQPRTPEAYTHMLLSILPAVPTQRDAYIKRIVAIPGDRIRVEPGVGVVLKGTALPETYLPADSPRSEMTFPTRMTPPGPMPHLPPDIEDSDKYSPAEFATICNQYAQGMRLWVHAWYSYTYLYQQRIVPHLSDDGTEFTIPPGYVFVMGDNRTSNGSFDSRYWGLVPQKNIKARAVSTFWPLHRLKLL